VKNHAQEMPVPVEIQFPLMKKILSYDRNLRTRCGDSLIICIVYQKRFRTSLNTKEEFVRNVNEEYDAKIENIPIELFAYEINSTTEFESILSKNKVDVIYLAPLRGIDIEKIVSLCNANKILTFTGIPEYVASGIIAGVDIKGERPQILINLTSAKSATVDFNSQLLKLSKILY
jgi:ABC-type uncharacterized transport system substrate-binding protein